MDNAGQIWIGQIKNNMATSVEIPLRDTDEVSLITMSL